MLQATALGFLAASTLLLGAFLAGLRPWSRRTIGLVAGFGVGALIAGLTLDLTVSAFTEAGTAMAVAGLALGAVTFSAGNWLLTRAGGTRHRKRSSGQQASASSLGIVLGTILDGVPESLVIGLSVAAGGSDGLSFLAAVAISNLPEAMSATTGLLRSGWTRRRTYGMWLAVALLSAAAAGVGWVVSQVAPPEIAGIVEAFAAGAVLTMLADTMMPEAFEEAGTAVGLATVLGYATAVLLTLA
jgi:ZIP family zinc transporter